MERERLFDGAFAVYRLSATFEEPFVRHVQVQEGRLWAAIGLAGCVIVPDAHEQRHLRGEGHLIVGQGSLNAYLAYGRGNQSWLEFDLPLDEVRLVRGHPALKNGTISFGSAGDVSQWKRAMTDGESGAEMRWASLLLNALSRISMVEIAVGLPSPIRELTASVLEDPARPWTLQEAAYQAGYSPFHLSRAFKRLTGLGFPIFVQKCRAQAAFKFLVSGEEPADTIARACGFGHAQAMRVALKKMCGFLPNEVRSLDVGIV